MPKSTADQIIAQCALDYPTSNDDCNKFLKAVAKVFFEPDLFTGVGMSADGIIAQMNAQGAWSKLGKTHTDAIAAAKAGKFVVAGMTSTELSSDHGHLAVVVGDDGQLSGNVLVPICYAGSLSANARIARGRVSGTFGATVAQQSKISYFSRAVDTVPVEAALDRVVDFLRAKEVGVEVAVVPAKRRKKEAKSMRRNRTGRGR